MRRTLTTNPPRSEIKTAYQATHLTDSDTLRLTCAGMAHKVRRLGYHATLKVFNPHCRA